MRLTHAVRSATRSMRRGRHTASLLWTLSLAFVVGATALGVTQAPTPGTVLVRASVDDGLAATAAYRRTPPVAGPLTEATVIGLALNDLTPTESGY